MTTETTIPDTERKASRPHTIGENMFDLTTYGGLALVGNELTATAIVGAAKDGIEKGLATQPLKALTFGEKIQAIAGKSYASFDRAVGKLNVANLNYFKPIGKEPVSRFSYIAFAIIGGFTMVPFIKALEDNKGKLVKFIDRIIHGDKVDTDPHMVEAHQEMDNAPKQSWGSLMQGRVTTVAAAYAVDTAFNYENGSITSKALKGTKLEQWSSLERISTRFTNWASSHVASWRKLSPEAAAGQAKVVGTAFSLLTFSAALTLIFYATSKMFAHGHEKKVQQKRIRESNPNYQPPQRDDAEATVEAKPTPDEPTTRIAQVENLSRVAPTPELAMGGTA